MTARRATSLPAISAIASATFTELIRLKLFYAICGVGALLIAGSMFLARFSFQEELQILKDSSLGVITLFSSLLAIVATANLIPADVADRTAYAVLAKAVSRWAYVIGKLLGVVALLAIAIAAMSAVMFALVSLREHALLSEAGTNADAAAAIARSVDIAGLFRAATIILVRAAVIAALTLFISTFATSNAFTVVVMFCVYLISHLQPIAREYWLQAHGASLFTRVFLAVVALVFPDLRALDFTDAIAAGATITLALFGKAVLLGAFYFVTYILLAIASFAGREL